MSSGFASSEQNGASGPPSKRIWIGNLPYHAEAKDVEQFLSEAGFDVERLDMSTDPETGRNPSYCFAELFSVEEAQRAISELPGASFMGRPLRVNVHTPKARGARESGVRSSPMSYDRSERTPRREGFQPRGGMQSGAREGGYTTERWARQGVPSQWSSPSANSAPQEKGKRLYVGGLPELEQDALTEEMRTLFNGYTVETVSKLISPHESKQGLPGSHHYCFVDLASIEEAEAAANALNGAPTQDGTLKISMARERTDRRAPREPREGGGQGFDSPSQKPVPVRDFGSSWRRGA